MAGALLLFAAGCAARSAWTAPAERDHPLVGIVYDVAASRTVAFDDLVRRAAEADFLLLGEQHDNTDHHRLQAEVLAALVAKGRRPALVFEQIDFERQEALDRALAGPAATPAEIAAAVRWRESGWPDFALYEPLFTLALREGLAVRAANLSRASLRRLIATPDAAPALPPLGEDLRRAMEAEIVESHCGHAPEPLVASMIDMQRRRDAAMADALAVADLGDGAVLVCGFGHARTDFGAAALLREIRPGRLVLSVGFVEVQPGLLTASGYAGAVHAATDGLLPFDFVVFTPRMDLEDPCEKYRTSLEKLRKG